MTAVIQGLDALSIDEELERVETQLDTVASLISQRVQSHCQITQSPRLAELETELRLVDEIGELRTAIQDSELLQDTDEFELVLQSVKTLKNLAARFVSAHPTAMLSGGLQVVVSETEKRAHNSIKGQWYSSANITESDSQFVVAIHANPRLVQVVMAEYTSIINEFVWQIGKIVDSIIALDVKEIIEESAKLVVIKGKPQNVVQLIDVVQTFVLAIDGLVESLPEIRAKISRLYGHYMVDHLVHQSIPDLFPEHAHELDNFTKDVEGLRGLQEVLQSEEWMLGNEFNEFVDTFYEKWVSRRQNSYLIRVRNLLAGEHEPNEWDWDGEADEVPASEPKENMIDVVKECYQELNSNLDALFTIYRALAPSHYARYPMELYLESVYLLAECSKFDGQEWAVQTMQIFARQQLSDIMHASARTLDKQLSSIKITSAASQSVVRNIVATINEIAESSAPAGPEIRSHMTSQAVEQVVAYFILAVERLNDISEKDCDNIVATVSGLEGCAAYFDDINSAVPSWIKLQRLTSLVQGRLADIELMIQTGQLSDFSAVELEGLLVALFIDSDRRQDVIRLAYDL